MVANVAGLTDPGGAAGIANAAAWLFGVFAFAPILAVFYRTARHPVAADTQVPLPARAARAGTFLQAHVNRIIPSQHDILMAKHAHQIIRCPRSYFAQEPLWPADPV